MNSEAMVSVVMPVYNGDKYLREAVDSILNQTFTDFEFIIINDGSTDRSREILESYGDPRIRLFHQANSGVAKTLNRGLKLARGEYIARQDADDISLPERLEKQARVLTEQPEVVLVSSFMDVIDSEGHVIGHLHRPGDPDVVAWYLLFHNYVAGHSQVMYRGKSVLDLGGYNENRPHSEDYDLWIRLSWIGSIVVLSDALLKYRHHGGNISVSARSVQEVSSLANTRFGIKELTGKELTLGEVEELRKFWFNHFPDVGRTRHVHSELRRIYRVFLRQRREKGLAQPGLAAKLRLLVGTQFSNWIKALGREKKPFSMLKVSYYACAWHPLGVLQCWLTALVKIQVRILRLLRRHA